MVYWQYLHTFKILVSHRQYVSLCQHFCSSDIRLAHTILWKVSWPWLAGVHMYIDHCGEDLLPMVAWSELIMVGKSVLVIVVWEWWAGLSWPLVGVGCAWLFWWIVKINVRCSEWSYNDAVYYILETSC